MARAQSALQERHAFTILIHDLSNALHAIPVPARVLTNIWSEELCTLCLIKSEACACQAEEIRKAFSGRNLSGYYKRVLCFPALGEPGPLTLLTTNRIFLPHFRMYRRNLTSLSAKGRSALITKMTKSALGTYSSVSRCWRSRTTLVPGVSTMLISRRISAGSWRTNTPS